MRLLRFHPRGYRNLQDLSVIFTRNQDVPYESGCSIRFLVGVNGTGKSNLLRFLSAIFSALNEGYTSFLRSNPAHSAAFELTYELRGRFIDIRSEGRGKSGITIRIDGDIYSPGEIPSRDLILPSTVMIYSSGDIASWQELVEMFSAMGEEIDEEVQELDFTEEDEESTPSRSVYNYQQRFLDENQQGEEGTQPFSEMPGGAGRVFLVQQSHLPLAFLSASLLYDFLANAETKLDNVTSVLDNAVQSFREALRQIGIGELLSFSLHLIPSKDLTLAQRSLLQRLYNVATIQLMQWDEQLWVYDLGEVRSEGNRLSERLIAPGEEGPLPPIQLFRGLIDLQDAGILRKVDLVLTKKHPTDPRQPDYVLLEVNLSDGERAFLEQMSLIYLLRESECLFILDEPEVHFNDTWRRGLVNQIELTLQNTKSEVILTTHGSVTITDAYPEEVILLSPSKQENVPLTLAAEPGEILRSVFKAELTVGERAKRKITHALDQDHDKGTEELEALLDRVGLGYYRLKVVEEIRRRATFNKDA